MITPRRLAAARRALERERQAVALFPELWPTETPEQRIERQDRATAEWWAKLRAHERATWQRAGASFRQLPPDVRAILLRIWRGSWHPPHAAAYFADLVRDAQLGRNEFECLASTKFVAATDTPSDTRGKTAVVSGASARS